MRIISGTLKGTKLDTLEGDNTRPTLDRIKEALFSKISEKINLATVLDLFSGSGALGIEAVSRGAKKVFLCDYNRDAVKIIKKNIEKTKTDDKILLLNCDYKKAIIDIKEKNKQLKFDIVFLDPPYLSNYAEDSVVKILSNNLIKDDGIIIIETDNLYKVIKNLNMNCNIYINKDLDKKNKINLQQFFRDFNSMILDDKSSYYLRKKVDYNFNEYDFNNEIKSNKSLDNNYDDNFKDINTYTINIFDIKKYGKVYLLFLNKDCLT